MHRRHRPLGPLLGVVALAAASPALVSPASAAAAPSTCQGRPVTIVATTTATQGTDGDDVVAMEPGAWRTFDARGGNDTICLAAGAPSINDRDPLPPTGFLDAGAGDDVVVNLTPGGTSGIVTTVVLGLGNDAFQGAAVGETVHAEKRTGDFDDPYAVDPAFVGPQADVVTGAATVFSSAPNDAPNADRIAFGPGDARIVLDGPMGPRASVDVSAATTAALEVRRPSGLRAAAPEGVSVDNRDRHVEVRGAPLIWWTGEVQTFRVGHPLLRAGEPGVTFRGGPTAEDVTLVDVPMNAVTMGSGDDSVTVESLNHDYLPEWASGGPGRDSVSITAVCRELVVEIDHDARCDSRPSEFGSFHDVVAATDVRGSRVTVVGSDLRNRLVASGERVRILGGGGSDEIGVDDSHRARVHAGAGADRVLASGDDVLVLGGIGSDRIELLGSAGIDPSTGAATKQQVARGGRGDDVLLGTTTRPDRLLGGLGRDRADGRRGRRDYCVAEVTRRCERP